MSENEIKCIFCDAMCVSSYFYHPKHKAYNRICHRCMCEIVYSKYKDEIQPMYDALDDIRHNSGGVLPIHGEDGK